MKKKRQLVGGILLMILGLGLSAGSVAFRYIERSGMGPFNAGHKIVSRRGVKGNYGFNIPRQRGFIPNPNFKQNPNRKQNPNNQAPNQQTPKNQTPNNQNSNNQNSNNSTPNNQTPTPPST